MGSFLVAQMVKNLPAVQTGFDPWVGKIRLEKRMATHSSVLAWEIRRTEEPGTLQCTGSQRVRHKWVTNTGTLSLTQGILDPSFWGKQAVTAVLLQAAPWKANVAMNQCLQPTVSEGLRPARSHASESGSRSSPLKPWDACSLGQHLQQPSERPWARGTQLSGTQIPNGQKLGDKGLILSC